MSRLLLAIAVALAMVGCGSDDGGTDAGVLPDCASIQPPAAHPSGSCTAGALCGHPPPEGWSCTCDTQSQWQCQFVGQAPDLSRPRDLSMNAQD